MMPGRPPKPTALKLLQGNPGKRKLPQDEPEARLGAVCPPSLTGKARELWKRWAPVYEAMGCLREADTLPFARWMQVEAKLDALEAAGENVPISLYKQQQAYAVQFGATPSARARIHVPKEQPKSKLERFRGGAQG